MRSAIGLLALVATGCGSHCKEVERARQTLAHDGARARTADVRVTIPFDRANAVIEGLLAQEPLVVPAGRPELGPIEIDTSLKVVVKRVQLQPAANDHVRFAVAFEILDADNAVVDELGAVIEVEPVLTRRQTDAELAIAIGPRALIDIKPSAADAKRLREAVVRWLPDKVKDKVPGFVLDRAVGKLGEELTDRVWPLVRERLGPRLGNVANLRLRLPDVPIAHTAIRSTPRALIVEIVTDLPVRRGLEPGSDDEIAVRLSGSTVAELANWALDKGYAPAWYNRTIEPRTDGQFRPRFDYLADSKHPIKVYSFQERGGCSYFRVGARATVAIEAGQLRATAIDRDLEAKAANPVIEVAAWTKYFLIGWLDRSKKVAAHTELTIGKRTLATRVTRAGIVDHEARFALAFDASGRN